MAELNCEACEVIREIDPSFQANGFGDSECTSLMNDTGIATADEHDDFTDLNLLNDCLVGNMGAEIDTYDVCDWKKYMKRFVPNLWTTLKGIICAIGGIWTNIHRLWCMVNYVMTGASFSFGETTTTGESVLVPGTGVDFSIRSASDQHAGDVSLSYYGGALARLTGSLITFIESFHDADGNVKPGNSAWNWQASGFDIPDGGELLYEVRIKKSEYPMLKAVHTGEAFNTGGGQRFFQCRINSFDGDNVPEGSDARYAYGQHGWCDKDGTPSATGYSSGHAVPAGWIYVQMRMLYVGDLRVGNRTDGAGQTKQGTAFSPGGYIGVKLDQGEIPC